MEIWGISIWLIIVTALAFNCAVSLYPLRFLTFGDAKNRFGYLIAFAVFIYKIYFIIGIAFVIYYGIIDKWYSPLKLMLMVIPIVLLIGIISKPLGLVPPRNSKKEYSLFIINAILFIFLVVSMFLLANPQPLINNSSHNLGLHKILNNYQYYSNIKYFSLNAFILGILIFAGSYLINTFFILYCAIWKIRIEEFKVFHNPGFALFYKKMAGTKFILGWLPIGISVRPFGFKDGINKLTKYDPKYNQNNYFHRSKYIKPIFIFTPYAISLLVFLVSISLVSELGIVLEIVQVFNYLVDVFQMMFSEDMPKEQFILYTKNLVSDKNLVLFAFSLLTMFVILISPVLKVINWFSEDDKRQSKIKKSIGFLFFIPFLWVVMWKIPIFIFSFFTVSQCIVYFFSSIAGILLSGIAFFFLYFFTIKKVFYDSLLLNDDYNIDF